MNILLFYFAMELAYMPNFNSTYNTPIEETVITSEAYTIQFESTLRFFELIYITGGLKSQAFQQTDSWTFSPSKITNFIEAGLWYKDNIKLGFRHICMHPEVPWSYYVSDDLQQNVAYDEFFIEFKGKFTLIK